MPSTEFREKIYKELLQSGILLDIKNSDDERYKPYELNERIPTETMATACFYSELHDIPVVLGDLPEEIFRKNLQNNFSLMQLQNIFSHCSRELAIYPDIFPKSPFGVACYLYPEIFLKLTDKYLAALTEYLIHKKFNNILFLLGNWQSESVPQYLQKKRKNLFEEALKLKEPLRDLVQDYQFEEEIEKSAIIDVLFHMEKAEFKKIKIRALDSQHYEGLYRQLLQKYIKIYQTEYQSGKKLLDREFLMKLGI